MAREGGAYLWNVVSSAKNITRMYCEYENTVKENISAKENVWAWAVEVPGALCWYVRTYLVLVG